VSSSPYGHGAGDAVLVEFAKRLGACVRETDTVARLGGDEFVVLIEGLNDPSEATLVAEKIRIKLEAPMSIEGRQLSVTSSIGIALVDVGDESPAAVTARADEALYRAKRTGRNRYFVSGKAPPGQANATCR
jgi:diguanylate cyclase (GGDEF)-like protein